MKKLTVLGATFLLGGCACLPNMRPQSHVVPHHQVKVTPAPVPTATPFTPNDQVKSRWYSHFPKHPKFFHH